MTKEIFDGSKILFFLCQSGDGEVILCSGYHVTHYSITIKLHNTIILQHHHDNTPLCLGGWSLATLLVLAWLVTVQVNVARLGCLLLPLLSLTAQYHARQRQEHLATRRTSRDMRRVL